MITIDLQEEMKGAAQSMNHSGRFLFWESFLLILLSCVSLAVVLETTHAGRWWFSLIPAAVLAAVNLVVYFRPFAKRGVDSEMEAQLSQSLTMKFLMLISQPVIVFDRDGHAVWSNSAAKALFDQSTRIRDSYLHQLASVNLEQVQAAPEQEGVIATVLHSAPDYENAVFRIRSYPLGGKHLSYSLTMWYDQTELYDLRREMQNSSIAVAYIMIDNLDELEQYVKDEYRYVAAEVDKIIKAFASSAGGIMKEYEKDRYLMLFEKRHLDEMIANRFSVLDDVRQVHAGSSNIPVTVSMGVAYENNTLAQKEALAKTALDTALQRGGDQVVYRNGQEVYYFGGRTKTMQKRSKVRSRVVAGELCELIRNAHNVLIMGHANADHDSIASCVAAARLVTYCGKPARICIRPVNTNVTTCIHSLGDHKPYDEWFVDPAQAIDLIHANTLLIINDVNNERTFEAPELYENIQTTVIIDHHRKTAEFRYPPALSYIDPSASAASELWGEILEQVLPVGSLPENEAHLMLAGILLDTNDFTRNAGVRTFAVAQYLRSEGGNTARAKQLFRLSLEDYLRQASYQTNVTLYRNRIALAQHAGPAQNAQDRIAAAKVADNLLSVSDVSAAFVLLQIGHTSYISARSDGTINVQLILEPLGGGGHYDVAGAQLSDINVDRAEQLLRESIDHYLDQN